MLVDAENRTRVRAARTRYGSRLGAVIFVPRAVVEPNRLRERLNLYESAKGSFSRTFRLSGGRQFQLCRSARVTFSQATQPADLIAVDQSADSPLPRITRHSLLWRRVGTPNARQSSTPAEIAWRQRSVHCHRAETPVAPLAECEHRGGLSARPCHRDQGRMRVPAAIACDEESVGTSKFAQFGDCAKVLHHLEFDHRLVPVGSSTLASAPLAPIHRDPRRAQCRTAGPATRKRS